MPVISLHSLLLLSPAHQRCFCTTFAGTCTRSVCGLAVLQRGMNTLQLQRSGPVMGSRGQRAAFGRASGHLISFRSSGAFCRARLPARGKLSVNAQLDGLEGAVSSAAHQAVDSLLPSWLDNLAAAFTTSMFLLADAAPDVVVDALPQGAGDALASAGDALADAAASVDPSAAAEAVADTASKSGGFFGIFSDTFESFLKILDSSLEKLGVPYSYGFAIILVTILVKVATYPLTKKQVESTLALQSLQPRVKELQAKYAGDAERLQIETAKLYQTAGVNPLAGCLPTLVTIPVFIGLYRALSNVADEGLLTEGFFWIPSLAGPTKLNGGLSWLWPVGGEPPLGWGPTAQYLVLPVLLIISQYVSQKIISPAQQNQDPQQQQANAILKFLPLMIGWFSLNVPSGLTLYWFANNILTTAQQAWLRSRFQAPELATAGPTGTIVKPKVEEEEEEKRPTGKELNARRSPKQLEGGAAGGGSGEKFRAIKAREAARKAAAEAARAGSGAAAGATAPAPAAPARGSKFAQIKAREAADKAAAGGPASAEQALDKIAAVPSSNGTEAAAGPAAVAVEEVVVAEVLPAPARAQHAQEEEEEDGEVEEAEIVGEGAAAAQHSAGPSSGGGKVAASGKKGKKGGKRK